MTKLKTFIFIFILFNINFIYANDSDIPLTVAETSNYQETSRYRDILGFIRQLQKKSHHIRLESIARSTEGREIPLIIIADPLPASPLELRNDSRAVVYLQGNIHGGEVEGKEALQILAREILLQKEAPYLDRLVILIAPLFNPDGNEKISSKNRPRQNGPAGGVGVRPNGQNLDLNRDGLKLETPEVRGLVRNVLLRWDPLLVMDSHTHNGSYHQEPITFVWSLNPNGDSTLINYMQSKFYSQVTAILRDDYQIECIPHGDFVDPSNPEKGWKPLGPQPRYLSNYIGLRNRLAVLNENYPYADFETRVWGAYKLFRAILDYCYQNKDELKDLIQAADKKTVARGMNPSSEDLFAIDFDVKPLDIEITIRGWEMLVENVPGRSWPRVVKTDQARIYRLPFLADVVADSSVKLPFAYLVPEYLKEVIDNLLRHGIRVEELRETVQLDVSRFIVNNIKGESRPNQGHYLSRISGYYVRESGEFPAGTYVVPMAQTLSNIAAYLLEPQSDDGLVAWNYFDRYLVPQWSSEPQPYPVVKCMRPVHLPTIAIRVLDVE